MFWNYPQDFKKVQYKPEEKTKPLIAKMLGSLLKS